MATGNMFQGMARGAVGDVVFSRANGVQVSRVRNRNPRNPRSDSQLVNRTILSTLSKAYSALRVIADHSYEGFSTGIQSQSEFMRQNQRVLRQLVEDAGGNAGSFAPKNGGSLISVTGHPYVVSRGSLGDIALRLVMNDNTDFGSVPLGVFLHQYTPSAQLTITYGDVLSSLGLRLGDQLTVARLVFSDETDVRTARWIFNRIVFSPSDAYDDGDKLQAPFITPSGNQPIETPVQDILLNSNYANLVRNLQFSSSLVSSEGTARNLFISLNDPYAGLPQVAAYFLIVSRKKSDGTYAYSNSEVTFTNYWDEIVRMAVQQGQYYTLTDAVLSWSAAEGVASVNEDYLDNANEWGSAPIVPGGDANNG